MFKKLFCKKKYIILNDLIENNNFIDKIFLEYYDQINIILNRILLNHNKIKEVIWLFRNTFRIYLLFSHIINI